MLPALDFMALILNVCTFVVQTFRANLVLMHLLLKLRLLKPISFLTLDSAFAAHNRDSDYFVVRGENHPTLDLIEQVFVPEIDGPRNEWDAHIRKDRFEVTHMGQAYVLDRKQMVLYHYATQAGTLLAYKTLLYNTHHVLMPTRLEADYIDEILFATERFDIYSKHFCTVLGVLDYRENRLWSTNLSILSLMSDPLGSAVLKLVLSGVAFLFEWFRPISSIVYEKVFNFVAAKVKHLSSFLLKKREILDFLSNFSERFGVCDIETGLINVIKKDTIMCDAHGCMAYLEAIDMEDLIDHDPDYPDFKARIGDFLRTRRRGDRILMNNLVIIPTSYRSTFIKIWKNSAGENICNFHVTRDREEINEAWINCAFILGKGKAYRKRVIFGATSAHVNYPYIFNSPVLHRLKK